VRIVDHYSTAPKLSDDTKTRKYRMQKLENSRSKLFGV